MTEQMMNSQQAYPGPLKGGKGAPGLGCALFIIMVVQHKLESRLTEEILITSDVQMTPPLWQKTKRK